MSERRQQLGQSENTFAVVDESANGQDLDGHIPIKQGSVMSGLLKALRGSPSAIRLNVKNETSRQTICERVCQME